MAMVIKGLELKVRKFLGLIPTLVEDAGEKLVEGVFLHPLILNRGKSFKSDKPFVNSNATKYALFFSRKNQHDVSI